MNNTFGGQLGQWLAVHTLGRKPGAQKFNKEVFNTIQRNWSAGLDVDCSSVTTDHVMQFAERVTQFCPTRWNAMVSALRFAVPHAAGLLKRRRLRAKKRALLSQLEFGKLLDECDKLSRSRAGLVIRFLSHTGMRITEAKQLRWVDVKDDHFSVPGTITKNGEPRGIPFINGVRETLESLKAVSNDFVLPRGSVRMGLEKACKRAGLPRLSHHDFRHLFATRCIQSGVDLPTVARWLGHSDGGALLARVYFHLVDDHSRRMAKRVKV